MKKSKTKYYKLISIMLIFCVALSCDNTTPLKPEQNEIKDTTTINHIRFASGVVDSILMAQKKERFKEIAKIEEELIEIRKKIQSISATFNAELEYLPKSYYRLTEKYNSMFFKVLSMEESKDYSFENLLKLKDLHIFESKDKKIKIYSWLACLTYHDSFDLSYAQFYGTNGKLKLQPLLIPWGVDENGDTDGLQSYVTNFHDINIQGSNYYLLLLYYREFDIGGLASAQVLMMKNDSLVRKDCFEPISIPGYLSIVSNSLFITVRRQDYIYLKYDSEKKQLSHNKYKPLIVESGDIYWRPSKSGEREIYNLVNGKFKKLKDE